MTATIDTIDVLHVDDEPEFAELVATFLRRTDDRFAVRTVESAEEALDELDGVDCVVSDYDMPGRNGIELLETIREDDLRLPFILYTGKGSEEIASEAISAGVTDYLQKETGTEQYELLANRIENAVESARSRELLAERTRRLETLVDTLPGMVYRCRNESGWPMEIVDGEVAELTGHSADRIARNEVLWGEDVIHPADRESTWEAVQEGLSADGTFEITYRIVTEDGTTKWVWERGRGVYDDGTGEGSDDGLIALEGFITDVTERREREARLERTTARLEALFERSPDMIDVHTADGTIVDVNRRFREVFDQPKDELVGRKVWEIDREADPDELRAIWSGMDVGDRIELETEFRRPDGEPFPVRVHATRLPVDDGDRFLVISRDVSEQKDRMRELRELKDRLQLAVEGADLGVWDWDLRTDEVEFNDRWARMLGYSPAEIRSHIDAWERRVHPDDLERVEAALEAHIEGETAYYDTEHRMRTADGDWKWIRDIGRVVERDEAGDPVRAVGIHLDVDERKEYERELERKTEELAELTRQREQQYRTLFEEAPVMAVMTRSEEGRPIVEDCNQQFLETLGYDAEDVVGRDLAEFYTPDSREALLDGGGYERALRGEFTMEPREFSSADGEVVETLLRAVPLREVPDAPDASDTALAMYVDVTEREAVKRANERLEQFASIVSHDLRNPLNVAEGRLRLARETLDGDDGKGADDHLEAVERAHDRMQSLIDDLLTLAREGDAVTETEPVDLGTVARECWETVETADASLEVNGETVVRADRTRLKQLFENLVRNAVEHGSTSPGSNARGDAIEPGAEHDGPDLTISVGRMESGFYLEDDGTGIPEGEHDRVFEAGYSTNRSGTGFGLSIVERIVEAHGWEVRATESAAGGARFEITGVEFES